MNQLTDEQLNSYESKAHKQVVEDDWVVVEWVYDLVKDVRAYKSQVEEMQKALEWYADEENYDLPEGEYYIATKLDRGYRARQTLQSIQGGNTP